VFCTQVDSGPTIGSQVPKSQPVSEQFLMLPVWADVRPLSV
jgi:hypothetical protein